VIPGRHERDLDPDELVALVESLAAHSREWEDLVDHDPRRRTYHEILRDRHVSAWLICWTDEQDTGFHDHDLSAGAVTVVRGRVTEERLALGAPPRRRVVGTGASFAFGAADIHRVAHAPGEPAVTLHAYSPPLWRMGAYAVEPDGSLKRHSVSYAEELRPLGAPLSA
jgi:predicted metal-dependent enzyme (double-stranded beta helix superfamily)